ncbi:MAG: TrkA C-terminal domain-containing protein [Candidatus Methanofastidiosia archaeon]
MEEVTLKIQKRAVKSRGRARLNKSMLSKLGTEEESKLEIINDAAGESVTVTLFADSMVEEGFIRLGEEDLEALGLNEGDTVIIRRKAPVSEQVRDRAGEAAERISEGIDKIGERATETARRVGEEIDEMGESVRKGAEKARVSTSQAADTVKESVSKAYGRIVEETAPVTERIESATKEAVGKIKEGISPTAEKAETKARDVYQKIVDDLPSLRERLSKAAEPVINRLKPDQGTKLQEALKGAEGAIRTATVKSDTVADKLVRELDLPANVVISAVQRNQEIVIPSGDTRLVKGDIVYLVGKEETINQCIKMLEG